MNGFPGLGIREELTEVSRWRSTLHDSGRFEQEVGKNLKTRTGLDIVMTVLIILQMGYHITGEQNHKWLGIILSVLFVLHHALNRKWYKAIFKGKYSFARIFRTAVNILLTVSMLGMILSGMMLARDIFHFLPLKANSFARLLHMACTAWGFVLMALHIGLHSNMATGRVKKHKKLGKPVIWIIRCIILGSSFYGAYAFVIRELGKRMFLTVQYAFFEFGESFIGFLLDYIAILILGAAISCYLVKMMALLKIKE